jgi:hypothetical protein
MALTKEPKVGDPVWFAFKQEGVAWVGSASLVEDSESGRITAKLYSFCCHPGHPNLYDSKNEAAEDCLRYLQPILQEMQENVKELQKIVNGESNA